MQKLRISSKLNLHFAEGITPIESVTRGVRFMKRMGFDAMDFSMSLISPLGDEWRPCIDTAILAAEENGIRFEICHLPYSTRIYSHPEERESFNKMMHNAIDAAAYLGVDYAVLHPNSTTLPKDAYDGRAEREMNLSHLSPFAEHAARVGLKIAVENMRPVPTPAPYHRYCQTPEELCDLADTLGFSVCWDFGHANIAGLCQSEALAYVGKRLKVLHVNDNLADDDIHLPPFLGTIDWADAMRGLDNIGFAGLFNYEIATARLAESLREPFAGYLINAAREIMKINN